MPSRQPAKGGGPTERTPTKRSAKELDRDIGIRELKLNAISRTQFDDDPAEWVDGLKRISIGAGRLEESLTSKRKAEARKAVHHEIEEFQKQTDAIRGGLSQLANLVPEALTDLQASKQPKRPQGQYQDEVRTSTLTHQHNVEKRRLYEQGEAIRDKYILGCNFWTDAQLKREDKNPESRQSKLDTASELFAQCAELVGKLRNDCETFQAMVGCDYEDEEGDEEGADDVDKEDDEL